MGKKTDQLQYELIIARIRNGEQAQIVKELGELIVADSTNIEAKILLGIARFYSDDFDLAYGYLQQGIDVKPDHYICLAYLGAAAIQVANNRVDLREKASFTQTAKVSLRTALKKLKEWTPSTADHPQNEVELENLRNFVIANLGILTEDHEVALTYFADALKLAGRSPHSSNIFALSYQGLVYLRMQNTEKALASFESCQSLAQHKDNFFTRLRAQSLMHASLIHFSNSNYLEEQRCLEAAFDAVKKTAYFYYGLFPLVYAKVRIGDISGAIRFLEEQLASRPKTVNDAESSLQEANYLLALLRNEKLSEIRIPNLAYCNPNSLGIWDVTLVALAEHCFNTCPAIALACLIEIDRPEFLPLMSKTKYFSFFVEVSEKILFSFTRANKDFLRRLYDLANLDYQKIQFAKLRIKRSLQKTRQALENGTDKEVDGLIADLRVAQELAVTHQLVLIEEINQLLAHLLLKRANMLLKNGGVSFKEISTMIVEARVLAESEVDVRAVISRLLTDCMNYAKAIFVQGKIEQAYECLQVFERESDYRVQVDPLLLRVHIALAKDALQKNDCQTASAHLSAAEKINSQDVWAMLVRVEYYLSVAKFEEAKILLLQVSAFILNQNDDANDPFSLQDYLKDGVRSYYTSLSKRILSPFQPSADSAWRSLSKTQPIKLITDCKETLFGGFIPISPAITRHNIMPHGVSPSKA